MFERCYKIAANHTTKTQYWQRVDHIMTIPNDQTWWPVCLATSIASLSPTNLVAYITGQST